MYTIEEQQVLVSVNFAAVEKRGTTIEEIEKAGSLYFCSYKIDWKDTIGRLIGSGLLVRNGDRM